MNAANPGTFAGRAGLVTGGGSGIGRATVLALTRRGASVLVADIDEAGGLETVRLAEEAGGTAVFQKTDASNEDDIARMVTRTVEEFGGLHFAHNNAGTPGAPGLVHEYDPQTWDAVFALNVTGTFLAMKYELAHMVENGGGAIVNTSSVSGLGASPLMPAYVASKHAVTGLTRVAGHDYATKGVRVNCVCPGVVRTPMMEAWINGDPKIEAVMAASEPIGRMASPDEIAEAVVWLCSDGASYVTGAAIPVDGAMTAVSGGGAAE